MTVALPLVDRIRRFACHLLRHFTASPLWAVNYWPTFVADDEAGSGWWGPDYKERVRNDPTQTELKHLEYIVAQDREFIRRFPSLADLATLLRLARELRNHLAHYDTIDFARYEKLDSMYRVKAQKFSAAVAVT